MEDKRVTAEQILAEIGIDVERLAQNKLGTDPSICSRPGCNTRVRP